MEAQQYKKNAVEIIALADGMTEVQWSRIQHLINNCLSEKKAKVTFENAYYRKDIGARALRAKEEVK